ncbi:major facilitator superfamily domain-containing protein [Truncatella angustata]|uniref:Major facilitator superfamily domain-containing protein n=1 Tax=Truncatella angustata TaxID=152316 RepID=A0A9P8UQD8_9PEZI|nr:major facilitator superfamily domain-containing protein [Truncatella angustata]KAH6657055.1 major facilitator superfamily domain-containing protein [Truncatella angustata]
MDNKFLDKPSAEQYEVMGTEPLESPKTRDEFIESYVIDTEEERKLVRKIDLYILPTMWIMYLLSYMDRTNIGNAKIAGMAEDLGLDSNRYSISLIVFFVGYVIWEVPSNMILAQTKPSIFLPTIMFLWGCATIGMAFIDTYKALVGLRVLIGLLESGFAPGVLLLLSSWYKPDEQARRFGVYISAAILSGAFGGLIAGSITGGLDGVNGMAGWRWLFITEGAATAVWSIVASFLLMDFPANTKRLTEPERELALKRLMASDGLIETEDSPKLSHWQALKEALINWRVWGFVVGYMAVVGSSTLSYFYPTLVTGLGYSTTMAQYMTIPIYAASFVITIIVVVFMDKYPEWRGLVLACAMGVSMLMAIIICVVYDFKVRYALLVIMACGLWASNGLSLAYASSTFSSKSAEVRGISLAFINAMGNLAQIYGSYLFPSKDSPQYLVGFGVIAGLCFTGVTSYLALFVLLNRYPQRR